MYNAVDAGNKKTTTTEGVSITSPPIISLTGDLLQGNVYTLCIESVFILCDLFHYFAGSLIFKQPGPANNFFRR